MQKTIGLITANYSVKDPDVLTENRPVASLPFLGRYRLIDFALSNMINAGISSVGIVMPFNYRSLTDHVGAGKDWGLSRKKGGLFVLPGSAFGSTRHGSRFLVRDLIQNKVFFDRSEADYVVVSSANFVHNVDIKRLVDAHVESGADITMLSQTARANHPDVMSLITEDCRVMSVKHGCNEGNTAFLDCFVVSRDKLVEVLNWYSTTDYLDLFEAISGEYDRVNVQIYDFKGYTVPVFNTKVYFAANMDMLKPTVTDELFSLERPIRTKAHDNSPAKFEAGAKVTNSRIAGSDRIYGTVVDSILGRSVVVESGAVVRHSVIMQNCIIKSNAVIENAIVDRNNIIPAGTELRGTEENLMILEKAHELS